MTAAVPAQTGAGSSDPVVAALWAAVDKDFLDLLGWDPQVRVLHFPSEHPQLGTRACIHPGCDRASTYACGLCSGCRPRWKRSGLPVEEYLATAQARRVRYAGDGQCVVPDCPRAWRSSAKLLCAAHHYRRITVLKLSLEDFLAHPETGPLPSFGLCETVACVRQRTGERSLYCMAHDCRLRELRRRYGTIDEEHWRRTAAPIDVGREVNLRGLSERVVAEVVLGLQQRVRDGARTCYYKLRPFCDLLRERQATAVEDLPVEGLSSLNRQLRTTIVRDCERARMSPESERHKDVWDLLAFGQTGWLYFTKISQPWLREAAKQWALDDMPRRRGSSVGTAVQSHIRALNRLSESLRLQRPDRGDHLAVLGRDDIIAYLNRMAYLEQQGEVTLKTRREYCVNLRRMLARMRAMGLTRPGRILHGLADDFALGVDDVPAVPDEDEVGHDLPVEVMQALCAHLPWLEQGHEREIRLAVELVIDTGRRPVEICRLAFDCLERDGAGKPVLVYDNFKSHRYGRRLPIAEATAGLITAQQDRLRAKYPDTPPGRLKLLPTSYRCLDGTRPISVARLQALHRAWVESLPQLRVPTKVEVDGQPVTHLLAFDKSKIFLYAYRHTYAQRHADAGVPPDVLQQLMDHEQAVTTQQYYRVGEQRRREAVERVTAMQFDRHGNRVWRTVKALLDTERLRRAVGEVAVPYGLCSEPSNVAAGGHDCPVRFRCVGCGHFSTDVSYLPDLEAYLADLLRSRERLAAVIDADAWAKTEATPSDEEIRRVRRLIGRVKHSVNELSEQERTEIEQATALVRRARNNVVHLGLPAVRQPLVDFRPDRTL
ncbi:hypothetical protein ABZW30_13170 [Kitasatospora sp. NPDC004669]|uniref:tyrosine-type recombinase/integrase n=1 Tax=Kitasatospora sp. NPDC004669 TaxID=3154555 RepID=UPI0033A1CEF5